MRPADRYLTREEKRRYATMPAAKIAIKLADLRQLGASPTIINQVRSIWYQRSKYEAALRECGK